MDRLIRIVSSTMLFAMTVMPGVAYAACTNPVEPEGAIIFNVNNKVPQVCTNTGWVALGLVQECTSIGDVCGDGSIFAGDTNLYVTDVNQSAAIQWKNAMGINDINPDSDTDGQANHDNRAGALADFPAFELCENLSRHGHADWYLPAKDELNVLYINRAAIGGFTTEDYWASTEFGTNHGSYQSFSGGSQGTVNKTNTYDVRCVRRK